MAYTHLRIPFHPGPDRSAAVAQSVSAASESVLVALEAYRKARRGERVALEVPIERIEWTASDRGRLLLRWREELDLACRMDRVGEGLSATVGFRLDANGIELEMLAPSSFEERLDEI